MDAIALLVGTVFLVALAAGAWAVLRLPVRWTLLAALALVTYADITPADPHGDGVASWLSVATPFQYLLIDNLNKLTGFGPLRLSGMEVVIALCAVLAAARVVAGAAAVDRRGREPGALPTLAAAGVSLAAVLWLELLGMARGGDSRQALWQFRYVMWLPLLTMLLAYALRGVRDLRALLGVLTATAAAKVATGVYYVYVAARGSPPPASATSHADSVLFVVTLAVWVAVAVERPTRARVAGAAAAAAWMLVGLVVNNRRTAFVTLLACLVLLFFFLPPRARRRVTVTGIALAPVLALYLVAGRYRSTGVFAPAASIWSVSEQKDASSITRDVENFNLLVTLRQGGLVAGTGWGHEYVEQVKGDDITRFFPQYRYIAHNSVLWLWSIGGLLGFTALWLPLATGVFLAARAHAFARTGGERAAAFAVLAVVVAYVIQAWSDMGVMSWTTTGLLATALVLAGKLAVRTGAWPAGTRLFARPAPRRARAALGRTGGLTDAGGGIGVAA